MSGLSRTPGKRVQRNTLTGVRIPPSPQEYWRNPQSYVAWPISLPEGRVMLQKPGGKDMLPGKGELKPDQKWSGFFHLGPKK